MSEDMFSGILIGAFSMIGILVFWRMWLNYIINSKKEKIKKQNEIDKREGERRQLISDVCEIRRYSAPCYDKSLENRDLLLRICKKMKVKIDE